MDFGYLGLTALGFGLSDYQDMFDLTEAELNMSILDCRAGASAFAADVHKRGGKAVAIDPLYHYDEPTIKKHVLQAKKEWLEGSAQQKYQLSVPNIESFIEIHETNVDVFLKDYAQGKKEGRYLDNSLPILPFEDETFDLALVSHYLFTYTDELSLEFHSQALMELLRVANEVRIFPLVNHQGQISDHVGQLVVFCQEQGIDTELKSVNYQIQHKGNAMLRVWSPSCSVSKHQQRESV